MKWFKAVLIAVPAFFGAAALTVLPTKVATAMYYYSWRDFWNKLANILLDLARDYGQIVIQRGYFRIAVSSQPIVELYQSNAPDAGLAAENGIGLNGGTLTVPEDIVLFTQGNIGVALKQGEYAIDQEGKFQFDLIRVDKPLPSSRFPMPKPTHL